MASKKKNSTPKKQKQKRDSMPKFKKIVTINLGRLIDIRFGFLEENDTRPEKILIDTRFTKKELSIAEFALLIHKAAYD